MPPANSFTACKACRRLKRKCSREVPSCHLCARLGKVCEYEPGIGNAGTDALIRDSESGSPSDLDLVKEPHAQPRNLFPCAYFLDPDSFNPIPRDGLTVSYSLFSFQPQSYHSDIGALIHYYQTTIHEWLPIFSIKRLWKEANKSSSTSIDILLFSVLEAFMTQSSTASDAPPQENATYLSVRRNSFMAECEGTIDLGLVQALILIALYELGHGIYPAAYLTIGRAVRLATMIGLQSERYAKKLFVGPDTWTLCEEQRRAWWAILILDTVVVSGSPELLMAAPDPVSDCLLPCNDDDWTTGKIGINEALLTRDFHSPLDLGEFARLCQASYILRKVVRHVQTRKVVAEVSGPTSEALQLHEILKSLDGSFPNVDGYMNRSHHAALSLCSIARLTLYNQYACNEFLCMIARERVAAEVELQRISLAGIQEIASKTVPRMAREIVLAHQLQPTTLSFSAFLPVCLYHAATECVWFVKEDDDAEMAAGLEVIMNTLQILKSQLAVCGKYLGLLESNEISPSVS